MISRFIHNITKQKKRESRDALSNVMEDFYERI